LPECHAYSRTGANGGERGWDGGATGGGRGGGGQRVCRRQGPPDLGEPSRI